MSVCLICLENEETESEINFINSFRVIFNIQGENSCLEDFKHSHFCLKCFELLQRISPAIEQFKKLQIQLNEIRGEIEQLFVQSQLKHCQVGNEDSEKSKIISIQNTLCKYKGHLITQERKYPILSNLCSVEEDFTIATHVKEEPIEDISFDFESNNVIDSDNINLTQTDDSDDQQSDFLPENSKASYSDETDDEFQPPQYTGLRKKKVQVKVKKVKEKGKYTEEQLNFLKNDTLNKKAFVQLKRVEDLTSQEIQSTLTRESSKSSKTKEKFKEFQQKFNKEKKTIPSGRAKYFLTKNFPCTFSNCAYATHSDVYLELHIDQIHNKIIKKGGKFACKYCDKIYNDLRLLKNHIEAKHRDSSFYCQICGRIFEHPKYLRTHMRFQHSETPRKTEVVSKELCSICGGSFKHLEMHIERVHNEEPPVMIPCEFCGKCFKSLNLLIHLKNMHGVGDKELKCGTCQMSFPNKVKMTQHYNKMHAAKTLACPYCPKMFRTNSELARHKSHHPEERKFLCTFEGCGLKCFSNARLKEHMRSHTGERPFPCTLCDMAFRLSGTLKKHLQTAHSEERPFLCSICGWRAKAKDLLAFHVKGVHEGKYKRKKITSTKTHKYLPRINREKETNVDYSFP